MPKITYNDKSNINPVVNRDTQATAEDFNSIKSSVNAIYDGTVENFYAFRGATEFVPGTLFYSVLNSRNESSVEFYAPTITSDTGTFNLGGATAISNSGENVTFLSLVNDERYNPVWIQQGQGNKPFARLTLSDPILIEYETSKADILVNPVFSVTISDTPGDHRTIAYHLESDTTITNVKFSAKKNNIEFFTADFGTLTANVERVVDMTIEPNVPPDVFEGEVYEISITSPNGDVKLKGSAVNAAPYFKANVLPFEDEEVALKSELDALTNPTWVEADSVDPDIVYGGYKSTGTIRKRVVSLGNDTYFQSSAALPIPSAASWADWQNREALIYT